jgi:uncharacterized membrane protein YccC
MAEAPEIPEANDPFAKRAAVTIAILAVTLAVVGNKGDNAKTDAIIKTNEAANQWAYYQAKGIKGTVASAEQELLSVLAPSQTAAAEAVKISERLKADAERYKTEQVEIKTHAEEAQKDAERGSKINDRCDLHSRTLARILDRQHHSRADRHRDRRDGVPDLAGRPAAQPKHFRSTERLFGTAVSACSLPSISSDT